MPTLECTVRSQCASCSHSEDEAVRHLGVKLFGEQLDHVERIDLKPSDQPGMSRWPIVGREA